MTELPAAAADGVPGGALADTAVPPAVRPAVAGVDVAGGVCFAAARWTPGELTGLCAHLGSAGAAALATLGDEELLAAWSDVVAAFRDPASAEREALDAALAAATGLSRRGLEAGLEAVLGGVARPHAEALFARAAARPPLADRRPALVVLAGNLPALAVQPLLPALALRRPVLLKAARGEPFFTAAFVKALRRRLPPLGDTVAAVTWPGGAAALEAAALAAAGPVLVYGGREAVDAYAARAPGRVVDYGPKLSLAVVGAEAELAAAAAGIARDVALFEQRGCLSVQAVFVAGERRARAMAGALAGALAAIASELPPGPLDPVAAARVQQLRGEAAMRGLAVAQPPLAAGTVLLEPAAPLAPSPGLRTVRVYPLAELAGLPARLAPWRGALQGAALAGADAWELAPALAALGVSRATGPGGLQTPDATWHNGGVDPLEALAGELSPGGPAGRAGGAPAPPA